MVNNFGAETLTMTNQGALRGPCRSKNRDPENLINIDYNRYNQISTTKLIKSAFFQHDTLRHRRAHVIMAGLYPTSQEIYVKQGASRYFHITSFSGRVIHFQVLRFIIFQIIGKIYHHSERF